MKEQHLAGDDEITEWLKDCLRGAEDVLSSAARLGLTANQIQELQVEAEFYKALIGGTLKVPRPTDAILASVLDAMGRWRQAVEWTESHSAQLDPTQKDHGAALVSSYTRVNKTLERLK